MTIIHQLDDFIFELFPQVAESNFDKEVIRQVLTEFYSSYPYKPKISIIDDHVKIEIDTSLIKAHEKDYQKALTLSDKENFTEAKKILKRLVTEASHVSEYHRVLGQIYSEEGDQDNAIDILIDALKWDPKNTWALLMMGNIFSKYKNDTDTALKYFNQAAKLNPDDHIALNNIVVQLMHLGKYEKAKEYIAKALELNPDYPNTHHALAMIARIEGDNATAFNEAVIALKKNKAGNELYKQSFKLAYDMAQELVSADTAKNLINQYAAKLEVDCGRQIIFEEDENINTPAKTEYAENYNRKEHIIRYKPNYPAYEHLVMHELGHIDFATQARKAGNNELFITNQSHNGLFRNDLRKSIDRLNKSGIDKESVSNYINSIFNGLNSQVYNTPIDLFIEDKLYNDFPQLRPWQFLSLLSLFKEGIYATTDKEIVKVAPKSVLSASKIYNLINAIQFNDLYGYDLTKDYNPSFREIKQAETFWEEFLGYRQDKEPAEEYELLLHWAEDLKLDKYFDLVFEEGYKEKTLDDVLTEIENNPFASEEKDPVQERQMKTFQEKHKDKVVNMAVVMYMVDALQHFGSIPLSEIKQVALQIAMIGITGISPDKKDYQLPLIPGKVFTGYQLLAYYYVSFALAIPDKLPDLQIHFDKEYEMAINLNK